MYTKKCTSNLIYTNQVINVFFESSSGHQDPEKTDLMVGFFCLRLGAPTRSLWEIAQSFEPRCRTGNNVRERVTFPCGSGHVEASNRREADDAVYGTGFAGVRGGSTPRHARSHSVPANSISYVQLHESPPAAPAPRCRSALRRSSSQDLQQTEAGTRPGPAPGNCAAPPACPLCGTSALQSGF